MRMGRGVLGGEERGIILASVFGTGGLVWVVRIDGRVFEFWVFVHDQVDARFRSYLQVSRRAGVGTSHIGYCFYFPFKQNLTI